MDIDRRDFRAMIFYDFKKGLKQEESYRSLVECFGQSCPSRATVFNWFAEFKRGRTSLNDEPRSGRPLTAVTPETIEAVRKLVTEDRRVTYQEIEQRLGIGSAATQTIIKDYLGLTKRCSRWVPHLLTDAQKVARVDWAKFMIEKFDNGHSKNVFNIVTGDESWLYHYDPETKRQSTVWCFEGELPPTKIRRSRSVGKKMVAAFFSKSGYVVTVPLETQKTVTADWYITNCVPVVLDEIKKRRPRTGLRGIDWHHDNASAHTAARTIEFFTEQGVKLLPHPPYSPDLAPCDFFLFPTVKEKLRGRKFSTDNEALIAYEEEIRQIPKERWSEAFDKWFYRMNKCIEFHGEYIEKI